MQKQDYSDILQHVIRELVHEVLSLRQMGESRQEDRSKGFNQRILRHYLSMDKYEKSINLSGIRMSRKLLPLLNTNATLNTKSNCEFKGFSGQKI